MFKIGDLVRCINTDGMLLPLDKNKIYKVRGIVQYPMGHSLLNFELDGNDMVDSYAEYDTSRFMHTKASVYNNPCAEIELIIESQQIAASSRKIQEIDWLTINKEVI